MWENWENEQGIVSGLFGIIEVRPSAGVCVLVEHLVILRGREERRERASEREGIGSLSRSGSH